MAFVGSLNRAVLRRAFGLGDVVELLDEAQAKLPKSRQAVVWLPRDRLDGARFPRPSTTRGRLRGQKTDRRFELEDGRSLHAVIFDDGWVELHIDATHPAGLGGVASHVIRDTQGSEGAAAAAALALGLGLGPIGAAATVATGLLVGANAPARKLTVASRFHERKSKWDGGTSGCEKNPKSPEGETPSRLSEATRPPKLRQPAPSIFATTSSSASARRGFAFVASTLPAHFVSTGATTSTASTKALAAKK
ncbi:MAG: hypothetical protein DWQ35_00390 [Planctomycetota bacterium]|nr:MAG: hypothetical protein DWQ35_00390 [Planctomycetota bacterium]